MAGSSFHEAGIPFARSPSLSRSRVFLSLFWGLVGRTRGESPSDDSSRILHATDPPPSEPQTDSPLPSLPLSTLVAESVPSPSHVLRGGLLTPRRFLRGVWHRATPRKKIFPSRTWVGGVHASRNPARAARVQELTSALRARQCSAGRVGRARGATWEF